MGSRTLIPFLILFCCLSEFASAKNRTRIANNNRSQREGRQRAEVVSCRVFQRKVCDTRKSNRLNTRVGVSTKGKCQQLCFATPRCTAFTFFEKKSSKGKSRCSL